MFPKAFLERMRWMPGEEYGEFLAALEGERHQALRLNALKTGAGGRTAAEALAGTKRQASEAAAGMRKQASEALAGTWEQDLPAEIRKFRARLAPVPWAEDGYYYETELQPGRHPFHAAGLYYIQEPSAMAPVELLAPEPGDRVLDLCAAPGGKSTQLAAMLQGRGLLLCNEIHPARAGILSENIERMGIRNACVTNETPERLGELFPGYFDKILVDAPCSGEGMFRKNAAACEEWSPENVTLCAARQDQILDCAAGMLRPGGRMVYSTCTFSREENEGSVERFLSRHADFRPVPVDVERHGLAGCAGELAGTVRLWPHKIRGEGHFAAVLERVGAALEGGRESALDADREGRQRGAGNRVSGRVPEKEPEDYRAFCRENLQDGLAADGSRTRQGGREGGCYIRFGDNLYLLPEGMPDLKGIKVLRPGLHLGELKKNRFEPSHALALALSPEEAVHVLDFSAEDPRVSAYLNGQAFPWDSSLGGEKGWYLICVDGFSTGWGKLAGGMMKNHYPRGLRWNV